MHTCTVRRALAPLLASIAWLATPTAHADPLAVTISYLGRAEPPSIRSRSSSPSSRTRASRVPRQGIIDDQTTGRFLKHNYKLVEHVVPEDGDLGGAFNQAIDAGERLFVADLEADELDGPRSRSPTRPAPSCSTAAPRTTTLRTDTVLKALFHTAPSRAMKADALAQYLAVKRWSRWFLIGGSHPDDRLAARPQAVRQRSSAPRSSSERSTVRRGVAADRYRPSSKSRRRSPSSPRTPPTTTSLVVADESDVFGEYLPYHTWDPRPVVGTVGLVPTAWSRVHEQWGGTQLQRRFEQARRPR